MVIKILYMPLNTTCLVSFKKNFLPEGAAWITKADREIDADVRGTRTLQRAQSARRNGPIRSMNQRYHHSKHAAQRASVLLRLKTLFQHFQFHFQIWGENARSKG